MGENIITSNIVYIILALLILSGGILVINKYTSSEYRLSELYSKEIALIIDNSNSGMEIQIDVSGFFQKADELKLLDNDYRKLIEIKESSVCFDFKKGAYSKNCYDFFNDVKIGYDIISDNGKYFLFLKIFDKDTTEDFEAWRKK